MGSRSLAYHRKKGHCRGGRYCHKCNNYWWCYSG